MTDLDLDALEAVARAATPGPWETRCEGPGEPTRVCHDSEYVIYLGYDYAADLDAKDAAHIATFDPPTVLALIARVKEAEAGIERTAEYIGTHGTLWGDELRIAHPGLRDILARYKPSTENGSER